VGKLIAGLGLAALTLSMASCALTDIPSLLIELEDSREFDARATEACSEALDGPATLIASSDTTAGQIRQMYERNEAVDPSSIDSLPAAPETYAALCLYDASEVADSRFETVAYWVSSDAAVGGIVVLAMWDEDDVDSS
jgi:hypothetical protein